MEDHHSADEIREREFVAECPSCGATFLGMTPEEFRSAHADECNLILGLVVFPEENHA